MSLSIRDNALLLDGQPFRLIGGAMHYARVPRPYWRDRLNKLIDLGCNTLETYAFWNAHEPYRGRFDFSGDLDAVAYVELAGEMGLNVIFRPGPYVCAEWDFGGLPWWLLNDAPDVRCDEPNFLAAVERYWAELVGRIAPLLATRGGPVVAVQVENEYGYFGNDGGYLGKLRDRLTGLGVDVPLVTSDGTFQDLTTAAGGLPGVLRTANFGSRAAERFATLRKFQPTGPLVCMEFWVGWFDEWRTDTHATRPADDTAKELDALLSIPDTHAVIYMFHGGTNFGFTAGGNLSDEFKPFVTSYDYDALLNECGDTTPKFDACREVVHRHLKLDRPKRAFPPSKKAAYGRVELTEGVTLHAALAPLSQNASNPAPNPRTPGPEYAEGPGVGTSLGGPVHSAMPLPMEKLGHGRGFVHYRTTLPALYRGQPLVLRGMHDWCHVRLNGRRLATWYRRDEPPAMPLDFDGDAATLDVLVHNLARSNFGHRMTEPKGLTGGAFVGPTRHDERALFGWTHHVLPLNAPPADLPYAPATPHDGPAFYRGTLTVDADPADTFVGLPGFGLGCLFVNGFNAGRYWSVGPQTRLYVPAPLLRAGDNELVVFEADRCTDPALAFHDTPALGRA